MEATGSTAETSTLPHLILLHDDVAGQHGPDLVLELQGAICELRVASAENPIGAKILAELRLERGSDVDIGEDAATAYAAARAKG